MGLSIVLGEKSKEYSFPDHPFNATRLEIFLKELEDFSGDVDVIEPTTGSDEDLLLFHTDEYVEKVKKASETGEGYLDYGDTPAFPGVYQAALVPVGSTLKALDHVLSGETAFNPVGGLHHARRDRAGGFCVFNDIGIAVERARQEGLEKIGYVDIDVHHGDGVFYEFEEDPDLVFADIHEDGRYLYPGTGEEDETGRGEAEGTKLNIPLEPGSGDDDFIEAFSRVTDFLREKEPELLILQCGTDGLEGDPLAHLEYTEKVHRHTARQLQEVSQDICDGRLLVLGGGGYRAENVSRGWMEVVRALS